MNCNFCGASFEESNNFCPNCGNNLKKPTQYLISSNPQQGTGLEQTQYQAVDFIVQRKILSIRPFYQIKDAKDNVFMEAKRTLFNFLFPHFTVKSPDGRPIGDIKSNLFRTNWKVTDAEGNLHAVIHMPYFTIIIKHFSIDTPNGRFKSGNSWFGYKFQCFDSQGKMSFEVDKKVLSLRETFKIQSFGTLSPFITTMSAICIDQRFYGKGITSEEHKLMDIV